MPVITRIITADSESSRSARSIEKSPALIQLKSSWLICRLVGGMAASASTCITGRTKASAITMVARPPGIDLGRRLPAKALTRKPPSGRSGISASTGTPLQGGEGFRVERFAMAEQRDHQRQADGGFSGRDGHHEEG